LAAPAKVLLVEDEESVCELFNVVLSRANFVCTPCATAEAAREMVAKSRFDVVVTDKNLPGESGLDLIAHIRSRDPDCAGVLVTGYPNLDSVVRAIELQNVEFLTKPLDSNETLVTVVARSHLRRSRQILAKRMLADLRGALSELADSAALGELTRVRDHVDAYRLLLERERQVMCWDGEDSAVLEALSASTEKGMQTMRAKNGATILAQCEQHQVSVLIVSDHFGDMDGEQLVERVVALEDCPELVYLTSQSSFEHAVAAIHRGAAGFLIKPVKDTRELLHVVRRAFDLRHERMVSLKMVTELTRILTESEQRKSAGVPPRQ